MIERIKSFDIRTASPATRIILIMLVIVQLTLLCTALVSIIRKPVRLAAKLPWILLSLVDFIGPILYFKLGSKRLDCEQRI
jgi:hypothetical protein